MNPQMGQLMQSYMGGMTQDPAFLQSLIKYGMENPQDEVLGSIAMSVFEQMMQPPDTDSEMAKAMDLITFGKEMGNQELVDSGMSILERLGYYNNAQGNQTTETTRGDIEKTGRVNELSQLVNDPEMVGLKDQYLAELAYLNQAPGMQAPKDSRLYVDEKTKQFGYEPKQVGLGDRFMGGKDASYLQRINPLAGLQLLFGGDPYGAREGFRTPIGNIDQIDYGLAQQYLNNNLPQ